MEATAAATNVHVYYETRGDRFVGDIDLILVDDAGMIVGMTDVTADGLPAGDLLALVNAQLGVFAGMAADTDERAPQTLYRNYDGRIGYMAAARLAVRV